jgi:hypothetical protein
LTDGEVDIEILGTRVVHENRWMRVREDAIRRRDGSEGIYGIVEKPDFVVIVPVEDDGRIHLRRACGDTHLDHEEQDLVTQVFPLQEIERMICEGEIKDATTVAVFGLLRLKGLL